MLNLEKNQELNLIKKFNLNKIRIGAGWDVAKGKQAIDLDLIATVCDNNNKLLNNSYFNYFNNLKSPNDSLVHSKDDTTGASSKEGDDEYIDIDFSKLPAEAKSVFIYLVSYSGQSFKNVSNEYVSISNSETNSCLAKYNFDDPENSNIENMTGVECAKFVKNDNNEWIFKTLLFQFDAGNKLSGLMQRLKDIEL